MLLAIDTATQTLGLALYDGTTLIAEQTLYIGNQHSDVLAPMVEMLLTRAEITMDDLSMIAATRGPGIYRHLRVGIALAKGLAVGANLPLIGINTLDIIAASQTFTNSRHRLFCVLQGTRQTIIAGEYRVKKGRWQPIGEAVITTWDDLFTDLNKTLYYIAGEIDDRCYDAINSFEEQDNIALTLVDPIRRHRRTGFLAQLAWQRYHAGDAATFVPDAFDPIYLNLLD